jgi:hypothetical protein
LLSATVTSATQVQLKFTDNAVCETGFVILRNNVQLTPAPTPGSCPTCTIGAHAGIGTVTFNDNTAALDQTYNYQVLARDSTLGAPPSSDSGPSNTATLSTAIPAPTGLTATVLGPTSIRLNWVDAAVNNTAIKVVRLLNGVANPAAPLTSTLGANATTYTNTGSPNAPVAQAFDFVGGNTYTYQVTAINGAVSSTPVTVNVDFRMPATPTGLAVGALTRIGTTSNDNVALTWIPVPNGLAATYTITRATNAGFTTGVVATNNLTGNSATLTVPRGTPGVTKYWFRIQGVNPVGSSVASVGVQSGATQ